MVAEQKCLYQQREDGIHQFTFLDASREAVSEFVTQLETIYTNTPLDKHVHLYLDTSALKAGPPLRQIARQITPFFQEFPERPEGSLAIITARGSVFTMLGNFLNLFSRSKDRFKLFREGQEDEAIRWLLAVR